MGTRRCDKPSPITLGVTPERISGSRAAENRMPANALHSSSPARTSRTPWSGWLRSAGFYVAYRHIQLL